MKTKTYEAPVTTLDGNGAQWHLTKHWGRTYWSRDEISMDIDGTMNVRTFRMSLNGADLGDTTEIVPPIAFDVANEWDHFEPKWTQHLERTPAFADALFS